MTNAQVVMLASAGITIMQVGFGVAAVTSVPVWVSIGSVSATVAIGSYLYDKYSEEISSTIKNKMEKLKGTA